jgi:hypothetical protein
MMRTTPVWRWSAAWQPHGGGLKAGRLGSQAIACCEVDTPLSDVCTGQRNHPCLHRLRNLLKTTYPLMNHVLLAASR